MPFKTAAKKANVHYRAFCRAVAAGEIRTVPLGGSVRILENDLISWREKRRQKARTEPAGSIGTLEAAAIAGVSYWVVYRAVQAKELRTVGGGYWRPARILPEDLAAWLESRRKHD